MLEKFISQQSFNSYDDFFSSYKVNIPENFNFAYDVVDEYARTTPEKVAMVWCNVNGDEAKFTFSQMKYYSDKAANFFKSIGIKKGDRVMLILKRRYEFWFSILALHKIGAICIPATHLLTSKDIIYRNNKAAIKMIVAVADPQVIEHIEQSEADSETLTLKALVGGSRSGWYDFNSEIESASDNFVRPTGAEATTNFDSSILYFTSGTTGMPKIVDHDFTYPLGHIVTAKYWQNVIDNGLHLTVSDTGWAKAMWGKIYGQWICGSAIFVYDFEKFVPKDLLNVVSKYGVTTFCAAPTIYRFFIKEDLSQYDLSKLKHCSVAGEPLNPEVFNQFLKATGLKLMEGYGQTELTLTIGTFPWVEPKPGSMGKRSPNYDIDILNENGESCKAGEEGQIVIRTDKLIPTGMFKGYFEDAELTECAWNNDIYYTGDVAKYDEDGYYWFVGRVDDIIKSSGYKIAPFEVESVLMEHPAVLECAVTGVPDEIRGNIIKATIVVGKGYTASDELAEEIKEYVKETTAPYKYPRIVEFVNELPKTISGKIRRVQIRQSCSK